MLTPGDGQDLFARFKHAWEKRDPDAMLELFGDDAEYRVDPFMQPLTGAVAIREYWNAIAAEQVHVDFDVQRVWVSGRTVLASWHAAFTRAVGSERIRIRGFSSVEIDDAGRIARMRDWPVSRAVGTDSKYKPQDMPEQAGE
jgi:uncharacterized protein (TIGR02246 family)